MKLIKMIEEVTNNNEELMADYFYVIHETILNEIIEYDALDKYIHMKNQVEEGKTLTQAPRVATNLDFTDNATLRVVERKSDDIAYFLIHNIEFNDFSEWIKDFDRIKFEAERLA
ncbi:hypothetical protein [Staphylococcus hominis]|uniref:Uncharacterized protein n=1 Tax=Staphylococcus hominis TaxID=1290 RepID=A0A974KXN1_STAHO|nr:hypothetical protein [Staphylococcus hominis]PTK30838.1 hypothetical protein BUZ51_06390 [Staphylococcus hominis]RIO56438.1 hypothetical protein BUZ49_11220 [Staphylococcus hominis]